MSGVGLGRSGRRGKDRLALSTDINVASLVDVAFTLLIIFIISAPILQGGMDVNLPQAGAQPVAAQENMFIVTIQSDDRVFLEQTPLSMDEMETALPRLIEAAGTETVFIKPDSASSMGIFIRVLEVVGGAGVPAKILVEPRSERRPRGN
jgi:biopolymer transport protein TolR